MDFVIRIENQILQNLFSEKEISQSIHLHVKAYKHFSSHSDYPVVFAEPEKLNNKYKEFLRDYMTDCSAADHLHKKIKEFQLLKPQDNTTRTLFLPCYILDISIFQKKIKQLFL